MVSPSHESEEPKENTLRNNDEPPPPPPPPPTTTTTTTTYDAKNGLGLIDIGITEEETEVDLADIEPAFLRGQTQRSGRDLSSVRIVKNPDGSMQCVARQQTTLAMERKELRMA